MAACLATCCTGWPWTFAAQYIFAATRLPAALGIKGDVLAFVQVWTAEQGQCVQDLVLHSLHAEVLVCITLTHHYSSLLMPYRDVIGIDAGASGQQTSTEPAAASSNPHSFALLSFLLLLWGTLQVRSVLSCCFCCHCRLAARKYSYGINKMPVTFGTANQRPSNMLCCRHKRIDNTWDEATVANKLQQAQFGVLAWVRRFLILHVTKIVALALFFCAMDNPGAIGWLLVGMFFPFFVYVRIGTGLLLQLQMVYGSGCSLACHQAVA